MKDEREIKIFQSIGMVRKLGIPSGVLKSRGSSLARYLVMGTLPILLLAGGVGNSAANQCSDYIKNVSNENPSTYEIGDAIFRMPFHKKKLKSKPISTPTIHFYYSIERHELFEIRDPKRPICRGWCDDALVMVTKPHRNNNVQYRFKAIDALSKGLKIDDGYMELRFRLLNDARQTSYWKLMPEKMAIISCDQTNLDFPACTISFDYSPSIEIQISFGKPHLPDSSRILDIITKTLDCLKQEQ